MGGNALKNCETRRYLKDEYELLCKEVLAKLSNIPEISRKQIPFAYRYKQSFGDMDVVIVHDCIDLRESIINEFNPKEIVSNGECLSFEYKDFQIDLIKSSIDDFKTSVEYYNWNDLGNLIGRIAHKFGLKYGHKGLSYIIKNDEGYKPRELIISKDIRKILDFLGFDFSTYTLGFDSLDDIYRYVRYSRFFNRDIFSFENMNHANRVRNKKRSTYQGFIDYLNGEPDAVKDLLDFPFNKDKSVYLQRVEYYFPEVNIFGFIESYNEDLELDNKVREKYNGKIVMAYTGLEGEELGKFMEFYKNSIIISIAPFLVSFNEYILDKNEEVIKIDIMRVLKAYKRHIKDI